MKTKAVLIGLSLGLQTACVPSFLQKYRQEQEVRAAPGGKKPAAPVAAGTPRPKAAVISQIGESVFRIQMPYDRVWDTTVDVLLRNYNLQIVERSSGILTTEWDSYYLDGKVHRNKVSIRLKNIGNQGVDLTIHNSVEVLSRMPDGGVSEGGGRYGKQGCEREEKRTFHGVHLWLDTFNGGIHAPFVQEKLAISEG